MELLASSSFGSGTVAAAAKGALAAARARLGVRRTALFWLDGAAGRLSCVATAGVGGMEGWLGQTLAAGVGMAGRAVREGRPVWTPDLLADPRVPVAPWLRERLVAEGLRAVAAAPVRMDGLIRGALGFLDGPRPDVRRRRPWIDRGPGGRGREAPRWRARCRTLSTAFASPGGALDGWAGRVTFPTGCVKAAEISPSLAGFWCATPCEGQGSVTGAVAKGKLHLIMYTGARKHYFPKYREDVDRMVDSIRIH